MKHAQFCSKGPIPSSQAESQEQASSPWRRDPGPRSKPQSHGEETQALRSKPQSHGGETQVPGPSLKPMQSHGGETQVPGPSLKPMEKRPKSQDQASSPWRRDPSPRTKPQAHGEETQVPGPSLSPMEKRPKSQESSLKSMERHRSQEPGSTP
ncbi:hypothetical protein N7497_010363 [Penicillium chrysogenum]|nr:hypothetical protein N7497_010363 [Penicillium chrysogenum]